MTYETWISFMESLALNNADIDHYGDDDKEKGFFILEREDVMTNIMGGMSSVESLHTLMFVLPWSIKYDGYRQQNLQHDNDPSYMILVWVEEVNNTIEVAKAMTKAELICHEVNKRIIREANIGNPIFDGGIEADQIEMNPILRFHSNFYGLQVFIPVIAPADMCVNRDKWADLEEEEDEQLSIWS
jgi:hypothetical protein